mgnify:FL=1
MQGKSYVLTKTASLHLPQTLPRRRRKHEPGSQDENKLTSMRSLSLIENFTSRGRRPRNRESCYRDIPSSETAETTFCFKINIHGHAKLKQLWTRSRNTYIIIVLFMSVVQNF